MQPRVLYVIDTLEVGGAERSTLEIATRLKNWHPFICYIYQGDSVLPQYHFAASQIISLGLPGPYQFLMAAQKLSAVLDDLKPDLVVATLLRSELIARWCCNRKGIPIVGTFVSDPYGTEASQGVSSSLKWKIRFFRELNRISAKWCVGFIANSEAVKTSNSLALGIDENKISVIPRGRVIQNSVSIESTDNPEKWVIGNVGRLIESKGQLDIINALDKLVKLGWQAELHIAGEGSFRKTIESKISSLELDTNAKLFGSVLDMSGFYRSCHMVVLASKHEGFSGAVLEAVLHGIPVIASDIPMNREILPEGSALFFNPGDSEDLCSCLLEVMNHYGLALERAKIAFDFASTAFDINSIAMKHEAYYDGVLSKWKT